MSKLSPMIIRLVATSTRSTPYILILLLVHVVVSILRSNNVPSPGQITLTDFLKRNIVELPGIFVTTFLAIPPGFFHTLLSVWNAWVLLGMFGWPAWSINSGSRLADLKLHGLIVANFIGFAVLITAARTGLGFAFGRAIGWAYPALFFNDAIHETVIGLSPVIVHTFTRHSLFSDASSTQSTPSYFPETSYPFLGVSILLWIPNAIRGPVFFWSFSAAAVAGVEFLIRLARPPKPEADTIEFQAEEEMAMLPTSTPRPRSPTPPRLSQLKRGLLTFSLLSVGFASISYFHSLWYGIRHRMHAVGIVSFPDTTLTHFLVLSSPRTSDNATAADSILTNTLTSYLPLPDRYAVMTYTTSAPSIHHAFDAASKNTLFTSSKGDRPHFRFIHDKNPTRPASLGGTGQAADLYSALSLMHKEIENIPSEGKESYRRPLWVAIMEDDFEWCPGSVQELNALLFEVAYPSFLSYKELTSEAFIAQNESPFCGMFIATGGSGLLIRPSMIPVLLQAIASKEARAIQENTDKIVQRCLLGDAYYPMCSMCASGPPYLSSSTPPPSIENSESSASSNDTRILLRKGYSGLVASRRMMLRHTGASASTYKGRMYPEGRWQCGWLQPFNGDLGVWVP